MTTSIVSTIKLCPINFETFNKINDITKNLEATLLFFRFNFHYKNSKLAKFGKKCMTRSREQIAQWFNFKLQKIDALIKVLEEKNLIEKIPGMYYGKKRLYFHIKIDQELNINQVNLKILECLHQTTGSIRSAIIFAKIAYALANTNILHEGKKYCCLTKEQLSNFSGLSIRTIDSILKKLVEKELIVQTKFVRHERLKTHFHIPDLIVKALLNSLTQTPIIKPKEKTNENNLTNPEKILIKVSIGTHHTAIIEQKVIDKKLESDIEFNKVGEHLTLRQYKYLESALNKTIERKQLKISSPTTLWKELEFSIIQKEQRKKINSFKHAVSHFMKILSNFNWKTPIGFFIHSEEGKLIKNKEQEKIKEHEQLKEQEKASANKMYSGLLNNLNNYNLFKIQKLTEEGIQFIDKMNNYLQDKKNKLSSQSMINYFENKISELIRLGADTKTLTEYAKGIENRGI